MKKIFIVVFALLSFSFVAQAQAPEYIADGALADGKTIIKADLMGLVVRNFGFSAERIINKKLSVNLGLRFMPNGNIPMLDFVRSQMGGTDSEVDTYLNDLKINSIAFTPEFRFYLGKHGYGRGFYLAPYYNFNMEGLKIKKEIDRKIEEVIFAGGIKTHSGGLMLGYQWMLGAKKNIIIDWGILGVHAGTSSGKLEGKTNHTMNAQEQQELKNELDQSFSDIPLFKLTSEVGPNSVNLIAKGPWAFLRASLSIGFRF